MDLLDNPIKPYAWGSHRVIAELLGQPSPSAAPEAELWLGAHPSGPSKIVRGGVARSLDDVIRASPKAEIGDAALGTFGARLPFLMKVLAAAEPLSLQAHPSNAQAAAGFDREDAAGIARDAPNRNYKDRSHKPELICALTPFDALCGFRAIADSRALLDALDVPELAVAREALSAPSASVALRAAFTALMTMPKSLAAEAARATVAACSRDVPRFARELAWGRRIGELYPGDVGVALALLMNLVHLEPGEALYLAAGNLHAYLDGAGIEIMAASDNVLRGGLTPKHVDVPELLSVLQFVDDPVRKTVPRIEGGAAVYDTPTPEFLLSRLGVAAGERIALTVSGPEIVLCTEGNVALTTSAGQRLDLPRGASAFVPASDSGYAVTGTASASVVFRAGVGAIGDGRATPTRS
jgi:mannose-6-phosphate isomerase